MALFGKKRMQYIVSTVYFSYNPSLRRHIPALEHISMSNKFTRLSFVNIIKTYAVES